AAYRATDWPARRHGQRVGEGGHLDIGKYHDPKLACAAQSPQHPEPADHRRWWRGVERRALTHGVPHGYGVATFLGQALRPGHQADHTTVGLAIEQRIEHPTGG